MKKLNVKTIGIAAAAAALFVLAGCGESSTASVPPESLPAQELAAPQETAGTLLLSVNPAIELDYDTAGDVLALNALNDDARTILAGYDSYYGRPADTVAAELVGEIDEGRLLRHHRRRERAQHRAASRARQRVPPKASSRTWRPPSGRPSAIAAARAGPWR